MSDEVQESQPSSVPLDKLAQTYIKMRDKRALIKKAWEVQDNEIKEQMDLLEEKMLDTCNISDLQHLKLENVLWTSCISGASERDKWISWLGKILPHWL